MPVYLSGDDGDQALEVGELWLYAAPAGLTAQAGAQRHQAIVRGISSGGNALLDTDLVYYNGPGTPLPSIRIEKAINAANITDDADLAPGLSLLVGTPITFTYQVFNDGATPILITSIRDDHGIEIDFEPAEVLATDGLNIGDLDNNGLLDPGEVWLYTSAGTPADGYKAAQGPYTNLVTVTGLADGVNVTDDDPANYFGYEEDVDVVKVRLEKAINAANPAQPTAYEDADFADGPILKIGSSMSGLTSCSTRATWR